MARVDSLIWFMAGFAQLFVGSSLDSLLGVILEITGGSSVLLGIYALIFVARHHKEFEASYSKLEKTTMTRDDQGRIRRIDDGYLAFARALVDEASAANASGSLPRYGSVPSTILRTAGPATLEP